MAQKDEVTITVLYCAALPLSLDHLDTPFNANYPNAPVPRLQKSSAPGGGGDLCYKGASLDFTCRLIRTGGKNMADGWDQQRLGIRKVVDKFDAATLNAVITLLGAELLIVRRVSVHDLRGEGWNGC